MPVAQSTPWRCRGRRSTPGGQFTILGGTARNRLAEIDTNGALTNWNPNVNNGAVTALAVSGSTVYAGGSFTTIGGTTRNRLAAIGTDGVLASWNPNADGAVNALVVSGSTVYAGGNFSSTAYPAGNGNRTGASLTTFVGIDLPISPTAVAATPADGGAAVSWTAPSYTGTGITGYKLESAPGPNYDTWTTRIANTGSTATSASVTGLTNGTNYQVRVTALGSGVEGGTSLASQWFTPNAPSLIPAVPTGLSATPGSSRLTLNWDAVTNWGTGASGKSYRAFVFSGATLVKFCNVNVPITSCAITGLATGSPYTVSVRSFNNLGKYSAISAPAGPYQPN